jgi:pimeloyl-ACP methyl ester carboxylesterase
MRTLLSTASRRIAVLILSVLLVIAAYTWVRHRPRAITVTEGRFPEELVFVRSADDVVSGGAMFSAPKPHAKPIAVIWIHGWGTNFYAPQYVNIGRALAARGYTTISGNTRMHDLANVETYRLGKRVRGGGYWGVASEEPRDVAAWIDFAEGQGFGQAVLVGHSAGWSAVKWYLAGGQDRRVAGVVVASGAVGAETRPADPQQLAEAKRMMAAGNPDDLVRIPNRGFPSFISAATFMDNANAPPELKDFFGTETPNAGITRVRCPLLAFYGTRDDVGSEGELELLEKSIARQPVGPSRVTTTMIPNADHMYTGEEATVAETIAKWADALPEPATMRDGGDR